ncbi:GPI ethanolamine phosphate transferase 3 [Daktulosphaira vitifoliae]|uniref:GPI ethanolamine phosphate transferase 3 n=1 Tax=Daktulosphaira vitifoliae TaxID=58002 RepID=UPI0021AAF437|nr:GPI ethanolamine phosphate transferase 3 [Daktulosphaira vitifoliae]
MMAISLVLKYMLILLWLICTFSSIILLFSKGLLLHRDVLVNKSSCDTNVPFNIISQRCTATHNKIILILIDALRYDFVTQSDQNKPYTNKITVLKDVLSSYPNQSRMYKFIADPPTTTMQRLNALTTGSLPTFIDIGSNFASEEISEDNVIDQLVNNGKKIVFLGDDTWAKLFPGRFFRNYSYPSFNVWDLDTVDYSVKTNLYPELLKDDWDVLIAHFLGVDHCGHRYGPYHKEMNRKLSEMNIILKDIIKEILEQKNIILFVFGDHGMTSNGDHGGESENEITSALFVLSSSQELHPISENKVQQIDLVPTVAVLMGIPIPFSNLGSIIKSAIPQSINIVDSIWKNVKQINDYLSTYSLQNFELDEKRMHLIKDAYEMLNFQRDTTSFVKSCEHFMAISRRTCEEVWIHFDEKGIYKGLVLMFLSLYFSFLLVSFSLSNNEIISDNQLFIVLWLILPVSLFTLLLYFCKIIQITFVLFIFGFVGTTVLGISCIMCWSTLTEDFLSTKYPKIPMRIFTVMTTLGFFSNSYIVEEPFVLHTTYALLLSYLVMRFKMETKKILFRNKLKGKQFLFKNWITSLNCKVILLAIILCALLRFSHSYWQCREEQIWCFGNGNQIKSGTSLLSIVVNLIFIIIIHKLLKHSGNLTGCSLNVSLSSILPKVFTVLLSVHWILESFQNGKNAIPYIVYIPSIILILLAILLFTLFLSPLLVHYVDLQREKNNEEKSFLEILWQMTKHLLKMDLGPSIQGYPIVYGLATVYSATFLILSITLCTFGGLLLGHKYAVTVVLMIISIWIMAMVVAVVRHNRCSKIDELYQVSWLYVLLWTLSSSYWFYGTGHNASFTAIHWNAAFVVQSDIQNNTWIPGFFILANTFFSNAVHAFLLPLLMISPFTICGVCSGRSLPLKNKDEQTMARGELLLAENSREMIYGAFNLTVKYILINCFRVSMIMVAATIHSRHLMMWKIFAPKLIFEGIAVLIITLPFSFLGFILLYRVTQKINVLFERIIIQHST